MLNLTLALLATPRPMAKSEIFQKVAGYSGTADSKERMFERDKDELRELGINIQVLPIHPLFDDELGYQILSHDYFLAELHLSTEEFLWLNMAAHIVREHSTGEKAQAAIQKILGQRTIDVDQVLEARNLFSLNLLLNDILEIAIGAIRHEIALSFTYNNGFALSHRRVSPYSLISRGGSWYLVALDNDDQAVKTFRLNRMTEVALVKSGGFQKFSTEFSLELFIANFAGEKIPDVKLRAKREISTQHHIFTWLPNRKESLKSGEEVTLADADEIELTEVILFALLDFEILSPLSLRESIIAKLSKVRQVHS